MPAIGSAQTHQQREMSEVTCIGDAPPLASASDLWTLRLRAACCSRRHVSGDSRSCCPSVRSEAAAGVRMHERRPGAVSPPLSF